MSNYRRAYVPGGTFFLTLVSHRRSPIFERAENVERLRSAIDQVRKEHPFDFPAAVILPDHAHFLWSLPRGDTSFSLRVGRLKVLFTRMARLGPDDPIDRISASRRKHRESNIWQRRFWEHTITNEGDFEAHLHYIHYNPVKHGLVSCPHFWPYSSFRRWVRNGLYTSDWGCCCRGRQVNLPRMARLDDVTGE